MGDTRLIRTLSSHKSATQLLKRTTILNDDFRKIFQTYNDENNFMFLDPPYDSVFTDYGYCKFEKKDHEELAKMFKNTRNKCLMVIGATEFIENLYRGYIQDRYPKN